MHSDFDHLTALFAYYLIFAFASQVWYFGLKRENEPPKPTLDALFGMWMGVQAAAALFLVGGLPAQLVVPGMFVLGFSLMAVMLKTPAIRLWKEMCEEVHNDETDPLADLERWLRTFDPAGIRFSPKRLVVSLLVLGGTTAVLRLAFGVSGKHVTVVITVGLLAIASWFFLPYLLPERKGR